MSVSLLSCAEDFRDDILIPDKAIDELEARCTKALNIGLTAEQTQAVGLVNGFDLSVLIFEQKRELELVG